jgi:hypothetical protein
MTDEQFKLMLNSLTVKTLAHMVRDLEETQTDWDYYPQDAPSEAIQKELGQTLEAIRKIGISRAGEAGLDFARLVQQVNAEQDQEGWAWQRDRQEQQNWTSDLE